ncbi:hypothetical protein E2I00_008766, partial [Balaenoptera physalus]
LSFPAAFFGFVSTFAGAGLADNRADLLSGSSFAAPSAQLTFLLGVCRVPGGRGAPRAFAKLGGLAAAAPPAAPIICFLMPQIFLTELTGRLSICLGFWFCFDVQEASARGGACPARGRACPARAGDARCDCPAERKALQFRVRPFALLPRPPASGRASSSGAGAAAANLNAVRETMEKSLLEISRILNTGLDMETLSICVRLCEQGINPEALSSVIKELRKAAEALKAAENMTS